MKNLQNSKNEYSEHDAQNAIRLRLSEMGYYTERINVGEGFLIPRSLMLELKRVVKGDLRSKLDRVSYFKTGAVKGRSDLSAIKDGRIVFLEVKDATGKPSEEQLNFIKQMQERYGCKAGIVRSVEDAERLVNDDDGR